MGDTRGIRALVAMVLLITTGFVTVASGPAAVAAGGFPDRCVERVSGDGVTVPDYSRAQLVDLDIGMPNNYNGPDDGAIELVNGGGFGGLPERTWTLKNGYLSSQIRYVIFDNEAPSLGAPPYPDEVRVRPAQTFPYRSPSGDPRWSVQVRNPYNGVARPIPFTAILTWSDCDEDRDYQGDAYDDNDGVADTSDNCPATTNADQTDWDGDRIGNACDTTPGIAPPPPSTSPVPPGTVLPPPGCTASCAYASTIGLRHRKARHRLTGKVESVAVGCRAGVEVTIWRNKSGEDRKLVVVTTRPSAKFRTRAPRRAGRYYATVGTPAQPLCGNATSRVVRIRKR